MTDHCEDWARKIESGDRRAVARAISAAEGNQASVIPLLKRIYPGSRRALVVGVTGAPGTGKSTLAGRLAAVYRGAGHKVGVLAVDPSSPFSGGALLGDRIRMQGLSGDEGIFIRSMATRGNWGGVAAATADAVTILEAAGCQIVLVETVGAGQDETEISSLASITLLLLVPGLGDEIQAFKAGLMEIADVFVINKADRDGADELEREVRTSMSFASELSAAARDEAWRTPVVKTCATTGEGVDEVHRAIEGFHSFARRTGLDAQRERMQARARIVQITLRRLLHEPGIGPGNEALIAARIDQVRDRKTDPYSVAEELTANLGPALKGSTIK
ncbi:MAG: methylmalonyl Co-A mutase-associated GTPase MeaB [Acidobacteriota bacterium]|nr:methylmalonyl Co-A mutase-associated GTPase MeaB [Acidobacteriota bacterium]